MTKPKSEPWMRQPRQISIKPVATDRVMVLFGYDDEKKPRAAKFFEPEFDATRKAAEMRGWAAHEGETKKLRKSLESVKVGNIYASGFAGVPRIRQSQYNALVKKLTGKKASKPGAPKITGYPADWSSIGVGQLVIAPSDKPDEDGYWAAVVEAIDGDILTLRLTGFPLETGKRHRSTVALLDPAKHG